MKRRKKWIFVILSLLALIIVGLIGLSLFGKYQMEQLSTITSDMTDMVKYLQIQLAEEKDFAKSAHEKLTDAQGHNETYKKMGIMINGVGASWMIDDQHNIIWHNGGTDNYNSYMAFDKETNSGLIILSNLGPDDKIPATILGIRMIEEMKR